MNLPLYFYLFEPLFNGYLVFYVVGYLLGTEKLSKKSGVVACIIALFSVAHSMLGANAQSSLEEVVFPYNGGYDILHLIYAVAIFIIFSLYVKAPSGNFPKKLCSFIAKSTFGVYLIHAVIMAILYERYLPDTSPLKAVIFLFVCTTLVSFPLVLVWEKLREFLTKGNQK